jgi:predicted AlkP superfamily pyrophosphatase or phosphodiesterase
MINRLRTQRAFVVALFCAGPGLAAATDALAAESPEHAEIRLVLQITVDGLRRDLVDRYRDRFGEGGFEYLLETGTFFANAHYQHANTETIVGHTTLATGAFPADHGMTGNAWYDSETGELGYNIEDPAHLPLPTRTDQQAGAQVDPAQKLARTNGRSPAAILAETFSDRLKAWSGGRSRVYAVAGKDRGAVSMAGHAGKAFWMSTDTGDFMTSRYYYDEYPQWVAEWNARRHVESLGGTSWELLNEPSSYLLAHQDDRPYEADLRGYGRVFPHQYAAAGSPLLPTQVLASPAGDRLTLDFAKTLLKSEKLGDDGAPDYLSISFSGVDIVDHFFGPSSLENEDMVLRLDRTLADLFAFIDATVGLESTLIVLSADHGMPEMPEYMTEQGIEAGRLYPEDIVAAANRLGQDLFEIENVVRFFYQPWIYLDTTKIDAAGLSADEVRSRISVALGREKGIALAVARNELSEPQPTSIRQQIQRSFHPERSGDIYVVQRPYWFSFSKGPIGLAHGSPWNYDTHVPIIFAGAGVPQARVQRLVHPVDVAPTLSAFFGMTAPAAASGTILIEVLP